VTRRAAIVAAVTMALGLLAGPSVASTDARVPRGDTNGCVVIIPAHVAICIPRF
jgi:hypothetical protein